MTMLITHVLILLLLQSEPRSQSSKMELVVSDKSATGAPLHATGSAAVSIRITTEGVESTAELKGTVKNVSAKPIMAFEAVIDLFPSYGGGDRVFLHFDYYFSKESLIPNAASEIALGPHKEVVHWNKPEHPITLDDIHQPPDARADVTVTFVQFADGTTFGVSQWGSSLTAQRKSLVDIMRGLLFAYDRDGEAGLKSAIGAVTARPDLPSEIYSSATDIDQKLRKNGAAATVEYLKDSLANAQRHSTMP